MPDPDTSPFHPSGHPPSPLQVSESQIQQIPLKHDVSNADSNSKLHKRIVMNPPPSFIQYLASIQPPTTQANGPMMINSNGQAVLISPQPASNVPPTSEPDINAQNASPQQASQVQPAEEKERDNGQVVLKGDKVVLVAPTETSTSTPTFSPTAIEVISSVFTSTPTPSSAITPIPSSTIASSATEISSTTSDTMTFTSTSTTPSSTAQVSTTTSLSSTTTIPSSSSSSSASSSARHQASAGIIFLIILLSLAIFVALISLLRYLVKSRRLNLPCMRRSRDDDDDDGLSDLVRGFDTPRTLGGGGYNPYLHAATYPHLQEEEQEKSELERRSSLFAHQGVGVGGKSPFLHSQSSPEPTEVGYGYDVGIPNLPVPPPLAHVGSGETQREESTLPHHLLGETGPLEVRNALPGEVESDEHHTEREAKGIDGLVGLGLGQGSPRFLGVNGNGLPVPWSTPLPPRPSSIDSFDNHQSNPNPFGSSSTLSASAVPGSVPLGGAPPLGFPSPSLSHDSLSLPQRSATWASNLRNTLYNAISAARAPTLGGTGGGVNPIDEDKFTRTVTVGNIYRNSSRRKAIPVFDLEKGLKVVDEKDDPELKRPAALDRLTSDSSDDSESTLVIPRRPGGAGERFKGYYARSKSSTNVSSVGGDEVEEVDQIRPSRMAGGARAAGARTGSFVIV